MPVYRPQAGPQTAFLGSVADIVIYGGAAGGGKSWGLLLDAVSMIDIPQYHGVIFRRESTEIRRGGSLLDESKEMYRDLGGKLREQDGKWTWPNDADIKFSGLQHESDIQSWKGSQLDFIGFDELTGFTEDQFWYFLSRNRSKSGKIKPYIRATCNPDPGWVLTLIDWWISKEGYPIPERSGILRWFFRLDNKIYWFDTKEEALSFKKVAGVDEGANPKSLTFIHARLEDNKALMMKDTEYLSNLMAMKEIDKQRLYYGNWRIKPSGKLFKHEWFNTFIIAPPSDMRAIFVDTAQEIGTANDYTVMQCWQKSGNKIYLISQYRGKPQIIEQTDTFVNLILTFKPNFAAVEKKANGSALIQSTRRSLNDYGVACPIRAIERTKDKYTRASEAQAYVESGFVYLDKTAQYYNDYISEMIQFAPENKYTGHDDQVDCTMDAIEILLKNDQKSDTKANTQTPSNFSQINKRVAAYAGY